MKKILLYSLTFTFLTMAVSALFVFGVINTSSGSANLIGFDTNLLHSSGEIQLHNQIVRNVHDIGNKLKEVMPVIKTDESITDESITDEGITDESITDEGITDESITDEGLLEWFSVSGQDMRKKLDNLTSVFEGNSFTKDRQIIKETFTNDYKPVVEELSKLLMDLKTEQIEIPEDPEAEAKITIVFVPMDQANKTKISNLCAKLIDAHNTLIDLLNNKRRY